MTTYPRVEPQSQFGDPTTTLDNSNCTAASYTMLGQLAAGLRLWPGTFRSFQSDMIGGISIPDGARAWPKAYPGTTLHWAAPNDGVPVPAGRVGDGITADTAWDLLADGFGLVAQGVYKVFEDAGIGLQPGFTEGHAIYVEGTRSLQKVGRQVYILDPLGRQPGYRGRWIAFDLLLRYCRALSGTALIYAAWAAPRLPDTDTEDPNVPGLQITDVVSAPGTVTVKAGLVGVQAVQVADLERIGIGTETKPTIGLARVVGGVPSGWPGNKERVRLIAGTPGVELAVMIDEQVDFKPAPAAGDVKQRVALAINGKIDATTERTV